MNKEFFVRLTLAAYRVAERMPGDENAPRIRNAATKVLSDLMIIWDQNPVTPPQKAQVIPRALKEISYLSSLLKEASQKSSLDPGNFEILEQEYKKVAEVLSRSLLKWQEHKREQEADPLFLAPENPAPPREQEPGFRPIAPSRSILAIPKEEPRHQQAQKLVPNRTSAEPVLEKTAPQKASAVQNLPDRQQKIVETLQAKDKIQIWELQKIFPHVTKRTLRRDMDDLLQYRLVEKIGEWNEVAYRLR